MTSSPLGRVLVLVSVVVLSLSSGWAARPAAAAALDWARFSDITGSTRAYSFTMQEPGHGFPLAEVASTSYTAARPTGSTTFLSMQTPVATKYGSSRRAGYVNLAASRAGAGQPSVTTYTFARPTPASGWTFVLGDIDADEVMIRATDADDEAVDSADLGFRSSFNYCAPGVSPKPSCGSSDGSDRPTWDAATATLTGNDTASDTVGASAWFEPSVPLTSLTFVYSQRSGIPIYQTWFSALRHDLTGTVTAPAGRQEGITLRLVDPSGQVVATTQTDAEGDYHFEDYATYAGYTVELVRPVGLTPKGSASMPADLSDGDAVVDFALRAIVSSEVSGTVRDFDADVPLGGEMITLTPTGGGDPLMTVTESDGTYLFDRLPAGRYTWSITSPDGYTVQTRPEPLVIPPDSDTPITDQDFVLQAAPSGTLSGVVQTSEGTPVAGAELRITGPDDEDRVIYTDLDGGYCLDDLPTGDYTIEIEVPMGYGPIGPTELAATIPDTGSAVTDQDFTLRLLPTGELSGTVQIDDAPPGVSILVEVTGGGVDQIVPVGPSTGTYTVTELPPGRYTVAVVTPAGTAPVGARAQRVRIDAAGTSVSDVDFALVSIAEPTPTPTPTPSPTVTPTPTRTPTASPSGTTAAAPSRAAAPVGGLSDTGGPAIGLLVGGLVVLAIGMILVVIRPRGRRG